MRLAGTLWALLLACCCSVVVARPHLRSLQDDTVGSAIMGGYNAKRGRYPWMASLHREDGFQFCGGFLIAPRLVVSAAHCIVDEKGRPKNRDSLVRIGGYNLETDVPSVDYEEIQIVKYWAHYQYPEDDNIDIALLALSRPSTRTPMRLPPHTPLPALPVPADSSLFVLGWGNDGWSDWAPDTLQEVKLRLTPTRLCRKIWPDAGDWDTIPLICAGNGPGYMQDACAGDSGGPLFAKGLTAREDMAVGLVNQGEDCNDVYSGEASGKPGMYTNLASFILWIKDSSKFLLGGNWTATVQRDPRISGFNGTSFVAWGRRPGQTLTLLTSPRFSLAGMLKRVPAPRGSSQVYTALESLNFQWTTQGGGTLRVRLEGGRIKAYQGQSTQPITSYSEELPQGGRRVLQAKKPHEATISQPGLTIRVLQPVLRDGTGTGWLHVWVTLAVAPSSPPRLGGVLGQTFTAAGLGITR